MELEKIQSKLQDSPFTKKVIHSKKSTIYELEKCSIIYQIGYGIGKHSINTIKITKTNIPHIQFYIQNTKNNKNHNKTCTNTDNLVWFHLNELTYENPPIY